METPVSDADARRILAALIAALEHPGTINPGLARHVREKATRALRNAEHRRIPSLGLPIAAINGITSPPDHPTAARL